MLQSPLSLLPDTTSESRHRASASLGKTHFKLALDLLPAAQSNNYYDEQWKLWMTSGSTSAPSSSSAPLSSSLQYDNAWINWMRKHSPLSASASSSSSSQRLFETVPRDAVLPIMSRLPLDDDEDEIAAEPTKAGNLDYLTGDDQVNGMHSDIASRGNYTRARLPEIDSDSHQLWESLHSLRAYSDDYSEGYQVAASRKTNGKKMAAPHPIADDIDQDQCPAFANNTSLSSKRALALVKKLFNWDQLPDLPQEMEHTWYGVAFRSKRRKGSESTNLYEDDRRSHEEAVNSGGLLMYWYGKPSEKTGHNLATCIWTSRAEAIKASSLPLHARAAVHSRKAYESFELNRYAIRKVQGETRLRLEEWAE